MSSVGQSIGQSIRHSLSTRPSTSTRLSASTRQSLPFRQPSMLKRQSLTKRKEKGIESDTIKDIETLTEIDLKRYCPQQIFDVLFINETDKHSKQIMEKIIEVSRQFEKISYLTFITYDEVIDLIENCDNVILPPSIKSILEDVVEDIKQRCIDGMNISPKNLARLMKLKLIEVMYKQYTKAVLKMQKRKKLITDLRTLTKDSWPIKEKNSKKAESKISLTSKKIGPQVVFDYTNIPIETLDDIVFDDDVHHHISYYVFQGFYNPELLKELIVNNNVDIRSVVKMTSHSTENIEDEERVYSNFWSQICTYFDGPQRCSFLENTFVMTFTSAGDDYNQTFEELLYVIRSISEIKLYHLNYIRHMDLFRFKEIFKYFPLECFTIYNNFLEKLPLELVSVPVILDTLLKQVTMSIDDIFTFSDNISQHSFLGANSFESKCIDPCSIKAFFKNKVKSAMELSTIRHPKTIFSIHENDQLNLILRSYKKYGPMICDTTTKMLKSSQLLRDINEYETDYTEIIHKHDLDPSTKTAIRDKDIVLHFLYLFLFSLLRRRDILQNPVETDLTKNLSTYDKLQFIKQCYTNIIASSGSEEEESVIQNNLYDTPPSEYFWKEQLESSALIQEIFKAQNDFLYCDRKFSPETDNLLMKFSDRLDSFGVNTKIYEVSLLTPICLRDFCRYTTIEQAKWLESHKPPSYIRKCIPREECQGTTRILDLNLFPEYRHLIETKPEKEPIQNNRTNVENEITFQQLVDEIKHYPQNDQIVKECLKSHKQDTLLVYDFGTKYFQIKGAKTTFQSHDDVKITVDNTRMLSELPKCTVNLNCRNNNLVLHSGKFFLNESYNFHMNLADGTIVSFIFPKPKKLKRSSKIKQSLVVNKNNVKEITSQLSEDDPEEYEDRVLCVDKDYFENSIKTALLNEEYSSTTKITFKPSESMLTRLKEATTSNAPIYKVSTTLTHIRKLKSEFELPLTNIVKRVLHNAFQKEEAQYFTKRYLSVKDPKQESDLKFDVKISVPNGLYVSFYPSQLKKDFMEAKQEYLCRNKATEQEEFRLFARAGYILIKKIDGCITVLKSNGDIVNHEKLDTKSEDVHKWSLKPCHCKTIDDYRKHVGKLLKCQNEDMAHIAVSRRACFHTKRGYVMNPETINILENHKIPYLKSSVLKFDGNRVCLESGKLRVKKMMYITFQNNFSKQEMYYERSDGFKSTTDKNGRQVVEFLDGTKITSVMHVSKELVDGYVYISLEFEYEHPQYATVAYRSDNSMEIILNNNVVLKKGVDDVSVTIDEDITTSISKEKVVFEKKCVKCDSSYVCNINIHPLVSQGLAYSDVFVQASDSYNKHFHCDFAGQCFRNDDYIKGTINAFNCKHYSQMSYKKLFVVERDFSGCIFWTDNSVMAKKMITKKDLDSKFSEFNDVTNSKIQVYKFKKNIYDSYSNRFLNRSLCVQDPKELVYSTVCVVRRMVDTKIVEKFCWDLTNYFQRSGSAPVSYRNTLDQMFEETEMYSQKEKEFLKQVKPVVVEIDKCMCLKEKIGFQEKIAKWREEYKKYQTLIRNNKLPCYFDSPFCEIIKKK